MKLGRFRSEAARGRFIAAYGEAMAALPAPAETTDVSTAFGTVCAYTWHGDDTRSPVLLLPGMSAGAPMWAENLPSLLESGRTFVAVDALGDIGMSVQTSPIGSMADQAQWLDETLERLGHARVHAVGHSFGGATAASLAVRHQGRLASLALIEPAFTLRWPPASTFAWAALATLPVPRSWRDHALAALGGVSVAEVRTPSPIGTLISVGSQTFTSALPTPRPLSRDQLASLRVPTYVAIAERRSLAGGAKAAERAREGIPAAEVEVWPQATHSLPMQERERIGERLRGFWDRAESTRRRTASGDRAGSDREVSGSTADRSTA
ncbi:MULTISPECIES: alpha/beta fold hydrolase [Microbacterium]|uniref:alpha/beta fold hydrolase n=1 Tax=Microbacterium TaxID=33882 RepID=UPI000D64D63E|nr:MULTISPECIES: alpha/beta fold hydrolase [Microbacterium]